MVDMVFKTKANQENMVDIFISRKASKLNWLNLCDYCTKYLLKGHLLWKIQFYMVFEHVCWWCVSKTTLE